MFFKNLTRTVLFILSVTIVTNIAYKFYLKKKKKERRAEINEVIMFCNEMTFLKESRYCRQKVSKSVDRLLHYLNSPRRNLDVCMYIITNTDVINIILKQHIRGVKVRVIMDADMAFSNGSAMKRFQKQGIPVRWTKSTNLMHHKFCLIDSSYVNEQRIIPFIITGSLNWTNQGLSGNWEDVIVTSQSDLVRQYRTEFERLWLQFKPIVN